MPDSGYVAFIIGILLIAISPHASLTSTAVMFYYIWSALLYVAKKKCKLRAREFKIAEKFSIIESKEFAQTAHIFIIQMSGRTMPIFSGWDEARWQRETMVESIATEAWPGLMEEFDAQTREEIDGESACRSMLAELRRKHVSACVLRGGPGRMAALVRVLRESRRRPVEYDGHGVVRFELAHRRWEGRVERDARGEWVIPVRAQRTPRTRGLRA